MTMPVEDSDTRIRSLQENGVKCANLYPVEFHLSAFRFIFLTTSSCKRICSTMSSRRPGHEKLVLPQCKPIGACRKLALLLQRSLRYSYRKRTCRCIPHIILELLLPLMTMSTLLLFRYGSNELTLLLADRNGTRATLISDNSCSQDLNAPFISSNDISAKCFEFPPSYKRLSFLSSRRQPTSPLPTAMIFQPEITDVIELGVLALKRLGKMNCATNEVL